MGALFEHSILQDHDQLKLFKFQAPFFLEYSRMTYFQCLKSLMQFHIYDKVIESSILDFFQLSPLLF